MNIKGFTLIELLVVIAIISILSSIVITSINSARFKATKNSLKTTGHSLLVSINSCMDSGGSLNIPNDPYKPTNEICSISGVGKFPKLPSDFYYDASGSQNSSGRNILHISANPIATPFLGPEQLWCGIDPTYNSPYCDTSSASYSEAICLLSKEYVCTSYSARYNNKSPLQWEILSTY